MNLMINYACEKAMAKVFIGGDYTEKEWFQRFKKQIAVESIDPSSNNCYEEYKLWEYIKKDGCSKIAYVLTNDESCMFSASKLLLDISRSPEKVVFCVLDRVYGGDEYTSPSGAIGTFIDSLTVLAVSLGANYFTSVDMLLRHINGNSTDVGDDGQWLI